MSYKRRKNRRHRNRHHLKNKVRGGTNCRENILLIDIEKHEMLHKIFRNDDLVAIISTLIRLGRMKQYERVNPDISRFYGLV